MDTFPNNSQKPPAADFYHLSALDSDNYAYFCIT